MRYSIKIWMIFAVVDLCMFDDISAMTLRSARQTAQKVVPSMSRTVRPMSSQGQEFDPYSCPDNDEQQYNFLHKKYNQKIDNKVDLLKVNRFFGTISGISYNRFEQIMDRAEKQSVQAGRSKMTIPDIYSATLENLWGRVDKRHPDELIQDFQIAVHEAGHALVGLYSLPKACIIPLITIERRGDCGGFCATLPAYMHKKYPTDECSSDAIMMKIAGRVAEQVASVGISSTMLTDKQEILNFLSAYHASDDIDSAKSVLRKFKVKNNSNHDQIEDFIIEYYKKTYEFLTKHKEELLQLAGDLVEKGTIYEDEISVGPSRHLYDFESGPLRKEHQLHAAYRIKTPKRTYGYDDQGNYVDEDGTRDQSGNLEELD